MNLEGRLLGNRYEIIEKIGNGGMATVYKAKCHVLNRFVAVKILRDEFITDAEFVKRFNAEAQSAASLTHPNIVSVFDVGNEGDLYYIVMELVQGKTLKEIIVEDGALSWKWSVNIAIQMASALETAHKNNIVHRDIKPHNIIITEDGIAKVTDFGIAKAVSNSTITAFGTTIGSVHYFSPEHARGGFTDAKSDLYSLGVVMYEMLTGRVPFDADTPVSVALKHMQEQPVEPIKLNPAIPVSVNKIIMKAMQKDGNLRYGTASEMLRDLNMAIKNPDGNFVVMKHEQKDFPTQKIPLIYDKPLEEKIKEKDSEIKRGTEKKKEKKGIRKFFAKHKALAVISAIIACILLFALAMGITYFALNSNKPKQIQIVNLVGKTIDDAKIQLEQMNVKLQITEEKYDANIPVGQIITQEPKYRENYNILEESTIKVVVSKGTEIVEVPKVSGMTKDEARLTLKQKGLEVEEVEETSKEIEAGYVIKQEPLNGEQVPAKSTVKIYVSIGTGIEQVQVPDILGKSEEEAKQAIQNAKLKVGNVKYEADSTKEDGIVIKQDIDSGTMIDEQSSITITVNQLPKIKEGTVNIDIKSITGYTEERDEDGNLLPPEEVEVSVIVGEDTQYKQKQKENIEKLTVTVNGIGTITVKVVVDGVTKIGQLNLNSSTPVLNIP